MKRGAVILAAGRGERMGTLCKALLHLPDGRTFVGAVVDTCRAAGIEEIVVVVAEPHADELASRAPEGVYLVVNPDPSRGMLSSVQTGLGAFAKDTNGVLFWPVDIPLVAPATVRAIAAADELTIPVHAGRGGHPLWIPRRYFGDVLELALEDGLRGLTTKHATEVRRLAVDDSAVLRDVDTPADLAEI